jgi:hypothetical protein
MENTQVINILNVAFLKIECQTELLRQEVKRIQSLSLRFRDWRNVFASREIKEACESTTSILNYAPLGSSSMCRYMVEKWLEIVRLFGIAITWESAHTPFSRL